MNAAVQSAPAAPYEVIVSGQVWRLSDARCPWPSDVLVTVLAVRDGWVRYSPTPGNGSNFSADVAFFTKYYERVPEAVQRSEEEKLRDRFERWARAHNWNLERDPRYTPWQYRAAATEYGWGAFLAGARGEGA